MTEQIIISVPSEVATHAKVLIPSFTQFPNWKTVALVGVPFSIGIGSYHYLYKGKSLIKSAMVAGIRFCQLSAFSVVVYWLAKRDPVELPIDKIKEALSNQFPNGETCPLSANLAELAAKSS